ncbi:MAG: hypothetical protein N3G75_06875 [Methanothrix sp.]|nr:hypothetical protein [Methanothrix sp.]
MNEALLVQARFFIISMNLCLSSPGSRFRSCAFSNLEGTHTGRWMHSFIRQEHIAGTVPLKAAIKWIRAIVLYEMAQRTIASPELSGVSIVSNLKGWLLEMLFHSLMVHRGSSSAAGGGKGI